MGLRKVPAEVVATISGAPQLMPHPALHWLIDRYGDPVDYDLFAPDTWRDLRWSIFDPRVRERTIRRKGGGAGGKRYLRILEDYLARHLARGRRFLELMALDAGPEDIRPYVFGGDCDATVARLVVEDIRGKRVARERAETVQRPLPDVDYHALIHDPGDSVVTRESLLGACTQPLRPGFTAIPPLRLAHSVFLCERHQFLTGNATFQNNLLHTLFNVHERPSG